MCLRVHNPPGNCCLIVNDIPGNLHKTKPVSHKFLGTAFGATAGIQHLKNVLIFIQLTWQYEKILKIHNHKSCFAHDFCSIQQSGKIMLGSCPEFLLSSTIQHTAHVSLVAHFLTLEFRIIRRLEFLYHSTHVSKCLKMLILYNNFDILIFI